MGNPLEVFIVNGKSKNIVILALKNVLWLVVIGFLLWLADPDALIPGLVISTLLLGSILVLNVYLASLKASDQLEEEQS